MASEERTSHQLPDDSEARTYLENLRWGGQPVCPYCREKEVSRTTRGWRCKPCRRRFTVTVRTIMESTKIPPSKWILAIRLAARDEQGITARKLADHLGVTMRCAYRLIDQMREGAKHASVRRQIRLALTAKSHAAGKGSDDNPRAGAKGKVRRLPTQRAARFSLWPLSDDAALRALITLPYSRFLDSD